MNGFIAYEGPGNVPIYLPYPELPTPMNDRTNPDHYKSNGLEVIDILKKKLTPEQFQGFCLGNVIKYSMRAGRKDGATVEEDLRKAAWYAKMAAGEDPRKESKP